jgi:YebC/PmpR family DNA-binding regulatory protein
MSGHSKWSQIKRQKGANDAKRGAVFTKIGREISIAAREGGGDPDANFRLRLVMDKARAVNMPADNIKRAIEKATGGAGAEQYEEIVYEGYGPGGVAILIETATDNKNRTAADVRAMFAKNGGSLAGAGSVAWQFEPRGVVAVARNGRNADDIALEAIDLGADDVDTESDPLEVLTDPAHLEKLRRELEATGLKIESSEVTMAPKTPIDVDEHVARQNLRLIDALEELDDVQRVTANFNLPADVLAELAAV